MITCISGFELDQNTGITSLSFPELESVGISPEIAIPAVFGGTRQGYEVFLSITNFAALASISAPVLETIASILWIKDNPLLAEVSFPSLTTCWSLVYIDSNPSVQSINLPLLETQQYYTTENLGSNGVMIRSCDVLESINLDSLSQVPQSLHILFNPLLPSLTLPALVHVRDFRIRSNDTITTISCPSLVNTDLAVFIDNNPMLTDLAFPVYLPVNGVNQTMTGNAFSAATVNAFLARCVAAAGYVSGTINLSGGTSAAPTGQGITDVATLQGRGVTVITN